MKLGSGFRMFFFFFSKPAWEVYHRLLWRACAEDICENVKKLKFFAVLTLKKTNLHASSPAIKKLATVVVISVRESL